MPALRNLESHLDLERKNLLLAIIDIVDLCSSTSELLSELAWRLQPILATDFFLLWFPSLNRKTIAIELWPGGAKQSGDPLFSKMEDSAGGSVWRQQKPLCIDDLAAEKRYKAEAEQLQEHGVRSCTILPLTNFRNRLGAFGFASKRVGAPLQKNIGFLQSIAEIVALSLDEQMPDATRREEAGRMRVLIECVNDEGASGAEVASLLRSLQKWAAADIVGVYVYDAASQSLRLQMPDRKLTEKMAPDGGLTPLEGTLAGQAFRGRRSLVLDYSSLAASPLASVKRGMQLGVRSLCMCPLTDGIEPVGVLKVARRRDIAFSQDDIEFLERMAGKAAALLRPKSVPESKNLDLNGEEDKPAPPQNDPEILTANAATQALMFSVASALIKSEELLASYFRASKVGLAVVDRDFRYLGVNERLAAMHGIPAAEHLGKKLHEMLGNFSHLIRPFFEKVLATREAVTDFEFNFMPPNRSDPGHWILHYIPIKDGEGTVTQIAMVLIETTEQKRLEESLREVSENLRQEKKRHEVLAEVTRLLAAEGGMPEVFPKISAYLRRVLHQEYAALGLREEGNSDLQPFLLDFPMGKSMEVGSGILTSKGPQERALEERVPVILSHEEMQGLDTALASGISSEGLKSLCWLPLLREKSSLGVLVLGSTRPDAFRNDDMLLLKQVAQQLAIALGNASRTREVERLKRRLKQDRRHVEGETRARHNFEEIIGDSEPLQEVLNQVAIISPSDATVLILGETGTGKGLIARAVHRTSRRKERKFVTLNCAAIPTGLLESELFGHERGAFTGAVTQKMGRLEAADGGTLFFDEIGEIPLDLQPKLLRVLQDHEFERLGGTKTIKVDLRLIAATNRNLAKSVAEKEFRSDLFYRLNVFPIRVPALREHPQDIPVLIRYFVRKFSTEMNREIETIPEEIMHALMQWPWPGNVRELENFIERCVILSEGPALHAPLEELQMSSDLSGQHSLEDTDREHIIRVLRDCHGLISGPKGAARRLGLKRSTLQSKMQRLGIVREDYRGKNSA